MSATLPIGGLHALAVPVVDRSGQAVGVTNLSKHSARPTRNEKGDHFLQALRAVAEPVRASGL